MVAFHSNDISSNKKCCSYLTVSASKSKQAFLMKGLELLLHLGSSLCKIAYNSNVTKESSIKDEIRDDGESNEANDLESRQKNLLRQLGMYKTIYKTRS